MPFIVLVIIIMIIIMTTILIIITATATGSTRLGGTRRPKGSAAGESSFGSAIHCLMVRVKPIIQGEEPCDTGGGRIFSLDASFGLLATASASAPALFLDSALCCCGVSCMI